MSYQIHITSTAEHDIMQAADYIEFTLKNPDAAEHLLDAVAKQIGSLADLPQKQNILSRRADVLPYMSFLAFKTAFRQFEQHLTI